MENHDPEDIAKLAHAWQLIHGFYSEVAEANGTTLLVRKALRELRERLPQSELISGDDDQPTELGYMVINNIVFTILEKPARRSEDTETQ